jgi:hypothetical protein
VVHVGTHKTGTTSIQRFLGANPTVLTAHGVRRPPGFLDPLQHHELPLLVLRPALATPQRRALPQAHDADWLAAASEHVRRTVEAAPEPVLVYSHEGLSFVRQPDEAARLAGLIPRPVTIVVFLREPAAYLRSYTAQLARMGIAPSDDPASIAYVEPDSWLVDGDALVGAYRAVFDDVRVLDYDACCAADHTVIPSLTDVLGIPRGALPPLDRWFANRTNEAAGR